MGIDVRYADLPGEAWHSYATGFSYPWAEPEPPAPVDELRIFAEGESSGTNSFLNLDARLASRMGTTTPLLAGYHGYSGNNFPSVFSSTSINYTRAYGYKAGILNVKCDWTQLANGGMDNHIRNFAASIPSDFTVYLLINHEPENDGNPAGAGTWRTGQARAANVIAELDQDNLHYAVCHMSYTWKPASGRNPEDWNPTGGMNSAAKARAIFAPDGYTTVRNSSGTNIDSMASEFDACWEDAISWGFERFAISEHAVNNNQGAPVSKVVEWWEDDHIPYIESIEGLVYYAFYGHTGPAAGTSPYIDTPEEETMFGAFTMEHNR